MRSTNGRLTVKEHTTILQRRCATTIATAGEPDPEEKFTKRGIIRVGPVEKFGNDGNYSFDISEQDVFEFRGRQRREVIWLCTVYVDPEHEVRVFKDRRSLEPVPPGVLECATLAIRSSEYELRE